MTQIMLEAQKWIDFLKENYIGTANRDRFYCVIYGFLVNGSNFFDSNLSYQMKMFMKGKK